MIERKKILIVEDEPDVLKTIKMGVEMENFEVIEATDGMEALSKVRQEQPNLIILDLMLPKMDGYKVCSLLKHDKKYMNIPVIVLTAKAQEKDEKLAKKSGADLYLTKPVSIEKVIQEINRLLK
jgi:two-component system, OmpR family, alkaline phosphatase synthesis response regulator PhoP